MREYFKLVYTGFIDVTEWKIRRLKVAAIMTFLMKPRACFITLGNDNENNQSSDKLESRYPNVGERRAVLSCRDNEKRH